MGERGACERGVEVSEAGDEHVEIEGGDEEVKVEEPVTVCVRIVFGMRNSLRRGGLSNLQLLFNAPCRRGHLLILKH